MLYDDTLTLLQVSQSFFLTVTFFLIKAVVLSETVCMLIPGLNLFLIIWHNCHSRACCVYQHYTDREFVRRNMLWV